MSAQLVLHINSSIDRSVGDISTSQWTTNLSYPIRTNNRPISIVLDNIELPNTSYTFPYHSSILWWEELDNTDTVTNVRFLQISTTRFFPDGSSFVSYMNSLLTPYNLVFSYDSSTARLTLTNNSAIRIRLIGSYRFSDRLDVQVNSCIDRLGYSQNTLNSIVLPTASITGQGILRLLRSSVYYLTCDVIGGRYRQSIVPSPYYSPNILARITSGNFGTLSQLAFAQVMTFMAGNNDINALKFDVLDDELLPVDLLGSPVTFTLRIIIN